MKRETVTNIERKRETYPRILKKKIEIPVYVENIKIVIQNLSKNKTLTQMA